MIKDTGIKLNPMFEIIQRQNPATEFVEMREKTLSRKYEAICSKKE
jgi:hypothetical protein